MKPIKVYVYPDYTSSWFWNEDGASMSPSELVGIPDVYLIAIENWHMIWEFFAADAFRGDEHHGSIGFRKHWYNLGKNWWKN